MEELKMEGGRSLGKLRRHSQLAPHDPDIRFMLARELARADCHKEAVEELQKVIALAPNHLEARKLLEQLEGTARA